MRKGTSAHRPFRSIKSEYNYVPSFLKKIITAINE